jgi:hypothetical protein
MIVNEYAASGGRIAEVSFNYATKNLLAAKGMLLDNIDDVFVPGLGAIWEDLPAIETFATNTLHKTRTIEETNDVLHQNGALWRTLIMDKAVMGHSIPSTVADSRLGDIYELIMLRNYKLPEGYKFEPLLSTEERLLLYIKPYKQNYVGNFSLGNRAGRCFFVTEGGRLGIGP